MPWVIRDLYAADTLNVELLPTTFELIKAKEVFVGSIEALREKEQELICVLGFKKENHIGLFATSFNQEPTGIWICLGSQAAEFSDRELSSLKKILLEQKF